MLFAIGQSAFTEFRLQQKLHALKKWVPEIEGLSVQHIFFLKMLSPINAREQQLVEQLLQAHVLSVEESTAFSRADHAHDQSCMKFIVFPRIGTISPWSTKAHDIFKNSGLTKIARVEHGIFYQLSTPHAQQLSDVDISHLMQQLHDPLTESIAQDVNDVSATFSEIAPQPLCEIDILGSGVPALHAANQDYGLALSTEDITYLYENFRALQRNPTDAELMMYGQVNSEHCRHKIFNAAWVIDGHAQPYSLFEMIRHTAERHPGIVKVAYHDNAAIVGGAPVQRWLLDPATRAYHYVTEEADFCVKVETHNHPTAISPWSGAATGAGGEIRDEAATGRGGYPKAGLTGFAVSHLHIPEYTHAWEPARGAARAIASPLEIMLSAPIGASSYNNEFGRPNLTGFFRAFECAGSAEHYGYDKPIMIAGGLGQVRPMHTYKDTVIENDLIIALGGAGMSIGLGGGAASSLTSGTQSIALDFASVQRANPEMQRRAQDVINQCVALGEQNPIHAIHDVGAGGLANAVPELAHQDGGGAEIELRAIPSDEAQMSPCAIWCNESQERYVLAVRESNLELFERIALRERCPYAVIARATAEPQLRVGDAYFNRAAVDISMNLLFSNTPRLQQVAQSPARVPTQEFALDGIELSEAIERVLQHPTVADKKFLITIGDRSVGGLVARDQMVGPWQVPVADVAVTANSFVSYAGEAMAMGERPPLALLNPAASVRMAIAEALTNLAAAQITGLQDVVLSANWMASVAHTEERAALYHGVAAASQLCQQLGISIPVGKDSLSMRTQWQNDSKQACTVAAPLSLVVSAFAPVLDIRATATPLLQGEQHNSVLLFIDLAQAKARLGGSILATVYQQQQHGQAPDVDQPQVLTSFFSAMKELHQQKLLLAYHDRSDGGLLATLAEMMFASHCGIEIQLEHSVPASEAVPFLFNEELGVVLQVPAAQQDTVRALFERHGLGNSVHVIARVQPEQELRIMHGSRCLYAQKRTIVQRLWSKTSFMLQSMRDHPECAQQEYDHILDENDPGLHAHLSFNPDEDIVAGLGVQLHVVSPPKVAILREQGVNGHYEMAAAFHQAGFAVIDVHMSDLINQRVQLSEFVGLAACGGFSYGDVLGAGRGWAQTILNNAELRQQFSQFFERPDTFSLGVCNGCQMLAHLKELIPGAAAWPTFMRNRSEQFEARLAMVEILPSPSIFLHDMVGSRIPIVVSHGEGYAQFGSMNLQQQAWQAQQIAARYVDHYGQPTEVYPYNPNGSPGGITALTSTDGRALMMMPHPERVFQQWQFSWYPKNGATTTSPWLRLFKNARAWPLG